MYNIIPLILILLGLSVIIVIVIRKFSVLAALNVETIQAEREANFKEKIISSRLKRNFYKYWNRLLKVTRPLGSGLGNFFKWLHNRLIEFKESNRPEPVASLNDEQKVARLFTDAEEMVKAENFDRAEKNYIEIISLDKKNIKAFRGLGKLYFSRKDFHEARQTFEHVLKLCEKALAEDGHLSGRTGENEQATGEMMNALAATYYDIALVCESTANPDGAAKNADNAIKLEPNNPRYLDFKVGISIIRKDKIAALDAYQKLLAVNPENQKLAEFEEKIKEL